MDGETNYTFEEFLKVHQHQLVQSSVPQLYWETLFRKITREIFDAGDVFTVQCIEIEDSDEESEENNTTPTHTWRVVVRTEDDINCLDPKHIYLIDHAWSYRLFEARSYLGQVEGLADRMAALMDVPTKDRSETDIQDDILKVMWRYNQSYAVRNYTIGTNEALPIWYVMDEFGSRIQHSDEPTFRTAPFMFGPRDLAYTILWPVQNCEQDDEVTRDYAQGESNPEKRKAMLLPWQYHDFKDTPYHLEEPDEAFFMAHKNESTDYSHLKPDEGKLKSGKLKVCIDYVDAPDLTDDRFEMVDTGEEADILWTRGTFKDFSSLASDSGCKYINQFPEESCLTVKDLLAVTARKVAKCNIDPNTLEGMPKWLPVTYNLNTELPQFISYFQHREAKGLDNIWILKPWNLSNSADTTVTDNLEQIIRSRETGPKVACKYVSNVVTLYREDLQADVKIDIRFLVFLASINPLRLYAYKPVSIRRGHKAYELKEFDDLRRHLTYVGLYEYKSYRPGMYTEEFVPKFEREYPDVSWSTVEASMHEMILELFKAAISKPPPAGLGDCPMSRALYGIDIVLKQEKNDKGQTVIQPMLCEVNFAPVYETWKENYPKMLNDAFSALFFDDIAGREDRIVRLAP